MTVKVTPVPLASVTRDVTQVEEIRDLFNWNNYEPAIEGLGAVLEHIPWDSSLRELRWALDHSTKSNLNMRGISSFYLGV